MKMWGNDMLPGSYMMDPMTMKIYMFNGSSWVLKPQVEVDNENIEFQSPKPWNNRLGNEYEIEEKKERKRGRPRIHPLCNKKRKPCEYNIYMKQVISQGIYNHLKVQERMKCIARDWKALQVSCS